MLWCIKHLCNEEHGSKIAWLKWKKHFFVYLKRKIIMSNNNIEGRWMVKAFRTVEFKLCMFPIFYTVFWK